MDTHTSSIRIKLRVVDSKGKSPFAINHAEIESGYFFPEAGWDHLVQVGTVNRKEFSDGRPTTINAVNRTELGDLAGTEGRFDVYRGSKQVLHVYWKIGPSDGHAWVGPDSQGSYQRNRPKLLVATSGDMGGLPWAAWSMPDAYELVEVEGLKPDSFIYEGDKVWSTDYQGTITLRIK